MARAIRLVELVRNSAKPIRRGLGRGDEGAEEVTADVSTPMSAKELATAALLPAIPSYKNMEYEVAKVTNKQSAIMEIEVDTLPSPFLRKHLPKQWKSNLHCKRCVF